MTTTDNHYPAYSYEAGGVPQMLVYIGRLCLEVAATEFPDRDCSIARSPNCHDTFYLVMGTQAVQVEYVLGCGAVNCTLYASALRSPEYCAVNSNCGGSPKDIKVSRSAGNFRNDLRNWLKKVVSEEPVSRGGANVRFGFSDAVLAAEHWRRILAMRTACAVASQCGGTFDAEEGAIRMTLGDCDVQVRVPIYGSLRIRLKGNVHLLDALHTVMRQSRSDQVLLGTTNHKHEEQS